MESHAGMSILVLEDDDICRRMTHDLLAAAGFKVFGAGNADEALCLLERGTHIDLAVIDIVMPPGLTHGVSFARVAQSRCPELKIILMSGKVNPQEYALTAKADVFLRKPYVPAQLLELVHFVADAA